MIVSLDWLRDFVDIDLSPEELADLLTNVGLESGVILEGKALDIDLTPNRPDCMSHLGVAREISILTEREFRPPDFRLKESDHKTSDLISVEIADPEKCPRYACRIVRNVRIGPSPKWVVERLETGGIRAINNVVDVSNYVLLEYGHPLHAFDLKKIAGNRIVVRSPRQDEHLTTLDGEIRELNPDHLLICDNDKPIALAGIMGGENSEVSSQTEDVLIESAYFDPVTVRKGARNLGLVTEASKRFERGTDYEGLIIALDRTCALLAEISGGEICRGIVDVYPKPIERKKIHFRVERSSAVAGVAFAEDFVEKSFEGLGVSFSRTTDGYDCSAPSFRPDLEREIDLVEELTRLYGYDRIQSNFSYDGYISENPGDPNSYILKLKHFFVGLGFHEILTNSLVRKREAQDFTSERFVSLENPLSREMSVMRTSLFPGLLGAVSYNLRRGVDSLSLFEYGNVFVIDPNAKTGCFEKEEFCGIICGNRSPKQWKSDPIPNDFFVLKGHMEALARLLRVADWKMTQREDQLIFAEGQVLGSESEGEIAEFGLLAPSHLKFYDIGIPVYGFRLVIDRIRYFLSSALVYRPVPQFPGISRDLSFVVESSLSVGDIEQIIRECGTGLLADIALYDLYEGDQIEKGHKSVTFSLYFRDEKRTLKDEEVDDIIGTIISEISIRLNAKLR